MPKPTGERPKRSKRLTMPRKAPSKPKKTGRPTKRTDAMIDAIVAGLSEGRPLSIVCRENDIDPTQIYRWSESDPELSQRIAHARELGFDAIAQEAIAIADDPSRDTIVTKKGVYPNKEWIERSKLRVHTRLQLLAKWDPKRYGDKVQHTGDGGGSIRINVSPEDASL